MKAYWTNPLEIVNLRIKDNTVLLHLSGRNDYLHMPLENFRSFPPMIGDFISLMIGTDKDPNAENYQWEDENIVGLKLWKAVISVIEEDAENLEFFDFGGVQEADDAKMDNTVSKMDESSNIEENVNTTEETVVETTAEEVKNDSHNKHKKDKRHGK